MSNCTLSVISLRFDEKKLSVLTPGVFIPIYSLFLYTDLNIEIKINTQQMLHGSNKVACKCSNSDFQCNITVT